jgi:hypothetical protein
MVPEEFIAGSAVGAEPVPGLASSGDWGGAAVLHACPASSTRISGVMSIFLMQIALILNIGTPQRIQGTGRYLAFPNFWENTLRN